MSLEVIIGIIGIILDIALADRVLPSLDGLYKVTAGFVFVFGFIGVLYGVLPEETASRLTGIYFFVLIIWYITKEEKGSNKSEKNDK